MLPVYVQRIVLFPIWMTIYNGILLIQMLTVSKPGHSGVISHEQKFLKMLPLNLEICFLDPEV